jgi:hypothetical protein
VKLKTQEESSIENVFSRLTPSFSSSGVVAEMTNAFLDYSDSGSTFTQ